MKHLLIRTEGPFPPSGYEFQDRITGKRYSDTHSQFSERVKQIIKDRLANRRLFTDEKLVDPLYVSKELSEYTCARLRNDPKYCTDGISSMVPTPAIIKQLKAVQNRICPKCGSANLSEVLCKTCSGKRVTGYKCDQCGGTVSL